MRPSYPAAIARLQSLVDRYPLYSKADEALFLLGQSYEAEIAALHKMDAVERQRKMNEAQHKLNEAARERMIGDFTNKAAEAYARILTRYPVMNRSDDAKDRLLALHQPVPRPTKNALALNKAEEAGRGEQTLLSRTMGAFEKHPDVTPAAKVGDPTLEDKTPISASTLVQQANRVALGKSGEKSVSVQTTDIGEPAANEPAPRSDQPAASTTAAGDTQQSGSQTPDPNELKTDTVPADPAQPATAQAADPNELKPNVAQDEKPAQAPAQVNDLAPGAPPTAAGAGEANGTAASGQDLADDNAVASSKHKKKKGLRKIIPLN
jgi:outer membrane protein assembly factor BamD